MFLPTLKIIGVLDCSSVKHSDNSASENQEVVRKEKRREKAIKQARDKSLKEMVTAMSFLQNTDRSRYGKKYNEID